MRFGSEGLPDQVEIVSKIFQGLFADADYHLAQAEKFQSEVEVSDKKGPLNADQIALGRARAHSRACVISVVAGTESLCYCIEDTFHLRTISELPADWIPRNRRGKPFKDWPVHDKVRFIPVLCCNAMEPPTHYLQMCKKDLNGFREIVHIRNAIIHGGMVRTRYEITLGRGNFHTITDDLPDNYWEQTHFPKDVRSISYEDGNRAYSLTMNLLKNMVADLNGKVNLLFLRDEELRYRNQVFMVQRESIKSSIPKWCQAILGVA